jgi:hypothetical protein
MRYSAEVIRRPERPADSRCRAPRRAKKRGRLSTAQDPSLLSQAILQAWLLLPPSKFPDQAGTQLVDGTERTQSPFDQVRRNAMNLWSSRNVLINVDAEP